MKPHWNREKKPVKAEQIITKQEILIKQGTYCRNAVYLSYMSLNIRQFPVREPWDHRYTDLEKDAEITIDGICEYRKKILGEMGIKSILKINIQEKLLCYTILRNALEDLLLTSQCGN